VTTAIDDCGLRGLEPGPVQFALIVAGALVMAASVGPTDAVVIDVIHPALRATGASILSLMRNLFGLAGGPLLTGALSDAYGLQFAMAVSAAVRPSRRCDVHGRRTHLRGRT
jgi:MFS family permease